MHARPRTFYDPMSSDEARPLCVYSLLFVHFHAYAVGKQEDALCPGRLAPLRHEEGGYGDTYAARDSHADASTQGIPGRV